MINENDLNLKTSNFEIWIYQIFYLKVYFNFWKFFFYVNFPAIFCHIKFNNYLTSNEFINIFCIACYTYFLHILKYGLMYILHCLLYIFSAYFVVLLFLGFWASWHSEVSLLNTYHFEQGRTLGLGLSLRCKITHNSILNSQLKTKINLKIKNSISITFS